MDEIEGSMLNGYSNGVKKKKRSQTSRRPRVDSQACAEGHDLADDLRRISGDENASCVHNSSSWVSSTGWAEEESSRTNGKQNGHYISFGDNQHSSKGVISPNDHGGRNGECTTSGNSRLFIDQLGNDNKVKKVKLKVGGVMRTIEAYSTSNGASSEAMPSLTSARSSEDARLQKKQNFQESLGDNCQSDRRNGLRGVPWKDFSRGGFSLGGEDSLMGKMSARNNSAKQDDKSESVRKRKRVLKKHTTREEFGDEDEDDDEIRYLEKLKTFMAAPGCKEDEEGSSKKHRKLSSISNMENIGVSRSRNDVKKSKSVSVDTEYEEEIELSSDGDPENKNKKQRKESVELIDDKRELNLTRRQRALQLSKDASSLQGPTLIEFPNGLLPAPSRKQKEKLSDVDLQLKKTEAAQKRRMQVEKAARESEAEAIKKILGQDSSRKKREDKIKKRREELAQEKAAYAKKLASNTIRWVMSPTGTVVTFPKDMGLPSIFDCKPCSYPPPREHCAGPSCTNPYKYRDSRSKLPLCSLQCYKAVQEQLAQTTN